MVPMMADMDRLRVGVAGEGPQALGRLRLLADLAAMPIAVYAPAPSVDLVAAAGERLRRRWPTDGDLAQLDVLFAGDLAPAAAAELALRARRAKVLLNTEDQREACDFHMPARLRRGDLIITVSTNGASPGLARRIAGRLARDFGPEWADRVAELARRRAAWRAEGLALDAVARETDRFIAEKGWLS